MLSHMLHGNNIFSLPQINKWPCEDPRVPEVTVSSCCLLNRNWIILFDMLRSLCVARCNRHGVLLLLRSLYQRWVSSGVTQHTRDPQHSHTYMQTNCCTLSKHQTFNGVRLPTSLCSLTSPGHQADMAAYVSAYTRAKMCMYVHPLCEPISCCWTQVASG